MTDADLDTLIAQGTQRLRLQSAVRRALLALGVWLLVAAALVLWIRLQGLASELLIAALVSPVAVVAVAFLTAYCRQSLSAALVASLIDRNAGTYEHLVTWHQLRAVPEAALTELQRGFRAAQRVCTLAAMQKVHLPAVLPLRLPEWSRTLGVAFLLLCCAVLVPPREAEQDAAVTQSRQVARKTNSRLDAASIASQNLDQTPRVQVFSPTDVQRIMLVLTNEKLTAEQRLEAARRISPKLAAVPVSEFPPNLKDAWLALEKERAAKAQAEQGNPASTQSVGTQNANEPVRVLPETPAQLAAFKEKAITIIRGSYGDVGDQLARYYGQEREKGRTGEGE